MINSVIYKVMSYVLVLGMVCISVLSIGYMIVKMIMFNW